MALYSVIIFSMVRDRCRKAGTDKGVVFNAMLIGEGELRY